MLRRLLAFLFVLAIALPAVAMPAAAQAGADCHGMPPAVSTVPADSMASHDEGHVPAESGKRALMQHGCIGCIAPYQMCPAAPQPCAGSAAGNVEWAAAALVSTRSGPETPPPRNA